MKLTAKPLAVIIFVILFGGIAFTSAMNWWQTINTKTPAVITEGEAAGQYDPADIRGSYTLADVEKSFKVPVDDLKTAFAVPADVDGPSFQLKGLETMYTEAAEQGKEVGTTSVRYFVALYAGLPFEVTGDIYLPRPAVEILKQRAQLSADQAAYLEAHIVEPPGAQPPAQPAATQAPAAEQPVSATQAPVTPDAVTTAAPAETAAPAATAASSANTIKGKTTFQELLDWGVPQAEIEKVIGGPLPALSMGLKDYCTQQGLDMETVKAALQQLVP